MVRGGAWAMAARLAAAPVFLLVNALLTRLLEPSAVGTYFLLASIVGVGATIGQLGLGRAAVRLIATDLTLHDGRGVRGIVARVLGLTTLASVAAAAAYFVLSETVFAELFANEAFRVTAAVTAGWLVGVAVNRTMADVFLGLHDVRVSSILGHTAEGLLPGLLLAAGLAALWAGGSGSLEWVIVVSMAALVGSALVGLAVLLARIGPAVAGPDRPSTRGMLRMSLPMMVTALTAFTISYKFELWVLAAVRPPSDVALYGAAVRLVAFIAMPLMLINSVIPPIIAQLYATGDRTRLERVLRGTALLAGLPAAAVLIVFVLGGKVVLTAVFGPYYAASAVALVLISVGQLASVWAGSCGVTLMMTGHEVARMQVTLATSAAALVFGAFGAWRFGIVGLAAVSAGKSIGQNVMLVMLARRRVGVWTHVDLSRQAVRDAWQNLVRLRGRRVGGGR